jgi:hypothetical protein
MEMIEAICTDCRTAFTIDVGEQRFFEARGYSLPKRCPACRQAKRIKHELEQAQSES